MAFLVNLEDLAVPVKMGLKVWMVCLVNKAQQAFLVWMVRKETLVRQGLAFLAYRAEMERRAGKENLADLVILVFQERRAHLDFLELLVTRGILDHLDVKDWQALMVTLGKLAQLVVVEMTAFLVLKETVVLMV